MELTRIKSFHPDQMGPLFLGGNLPGEEEVHPHHGSYSGVPRRGGTSAGSPPIQCGMSAICSPTVRTPAQDASDNTATHRTAALLLRFSCRIRITRKQINPDRIRSI